ncbi:MAG: contractile injection system protein, VgrG/Pvc8 family, partial [Pseudomonadota bacterium]
MATDSSQGGLQRQPDFRITLGGKDITAIVNPRLVSLALTQCRGGEADQLDLVLDDADGQLELPRTGVQLALAIGWAGADLTDKGTFTVDEVEHAGAPDQVQIRARSADLRAGLRNRAEQSWHATTLGTVGQTIARRNGLQARIDAGLAATPIEHADQTNESDINFITRLAMRHDAVATVK